MCTILWNGNHGIRQKREGICYPGCIWASTQRLYGFRRLAFEEASTNEWTGVAVSSADVCHNLLYCHAERAEWQDWREQRHVGSGQVICHFRRVLAAGHWPRSDSTTLPSLQQLCVPLTGSSTPDMYFGGVRFWSRSGYFWYITHSSLLKIDRRFGGECYLYILGLRRSHKWNYMTETPVSQSLKLTTVLLTPFLLTGSKLVSSS